MRSRYLFWIASSLAVGTSACTTLQPPRLDMAGACANWRWIGISRPEARCPDVPGWTVRPLFAQLAPVRRESGDYCDQQGSEKAPNLELIRELNRFCVYEVAGWKKRLGHYSFPPAVGAELVRLDQDCAALSLGEKYLPTKTWTLDRALYLEQAGAPEAPPIENQRGVRLSFLDTQPTGRDIPERQGSSPHGYTLTRIAEALVCTPEPDVRCAAQITTRLALPIIDFDPKNPKKNWIDRDRGGYIGMQSDLAEAIRSEVDSWREEGLQRHLVLNLSVAWDGELFGGFDEQIDDMRAGTQAVYRALQYAAGFDALVLAAAGNQKREPCANIGPLLPAAWEREAPWEDSCKTKKEGEGPLLYAVGGIKADKQPLENARPGGMPKRAAYGETGLFTGSSVATAVASSIAAVVWNYFPDRSSHEIMRILDSEVKENELRFRADFWFGASAPLMTPAPAVHQLSLCTALKEACRQWASPACPITCDPLPMSESLVPGFGNGRAAARGSCQPWNFPQPEDDPCPNCIKPPPPPM